MFTNTEYGTVLALEPCLTHVAGVYKKIQIIGSIIKSKYLVAPTLRIYRHSTSIQRNPESRAMLVL